MSIWQGIIAIAYVGAIGFAAWQGRFAPVVWVILAGNFIASATLAGDPIATGIVDVLTMALLIAEFSPLSLSLAACFLVCATLDGFAAKFGLSDYSTATIVDFMIIPIALIVGCLNGDGGRLSRIFDPAGNFARHYLHIGGGHSLGSRGDAPLYLAPDQRVVASREVNRGR